MRRSEALPLAAMVLVTIAALAFTFVNDNRPLLGLDLQGGVSVVLQPTEEVDEEQIDQAIDIIRRRVDALGVAEPDISRQGSTVLVQLPGVDDPQRALDLVGQTAELRFRPVLDIIPPEGIDLSESLATTTTAAGDTTDTTTGDTDETTPTTVDPLADLQAQIDRPTTAPEDDDPDVEVILPQVDDDGEVVQRFVLGPSALRGDALSTANAILQGISEWVVNVEFRGGADGIDGFNQISASCHARTPQCPTGQLAIVLDSEVVSAPAIQPTNATFVPFSADQVVISGGFDEATAKDLALVLRFGALPVELEPQQTQTVSASIGGDALDAGITAGLVGLALVAVYMLAYYRLLGLVAIISLLVSFALLWSIVSWLGETQGLALTLAGVTGLIVSIGVSVDSNVVYFENIKEDVRGGRPVRSSVERSFAGAFSTIVKADVTTLIGATLLYLLTIGPVRGFALYLGLATLLDLVVSYFLMRPLVVWLGRSSLRDRPRLLGIPLADPAPAPAPAMAGGGS
ncbi:MAG TPA: protein translocase subunit SecD [Acidimicrobiales bacterium]|nr:protein translocase subunit SecD [Acidimicrobiales bacterium]